MALSPASLAARFRLATTADVPAIRRFFAGQLDRGAEQFDALNPFTQSVLGICVPLADVWIVTVRRKVVAAGWFHLLQAGAVRVVALTDPGRNEFLDPLLAYIEAALQVIAYHQRVPLIQIIAWLPEGIHQPRLAAGYTRRGWTVTELPWFAPLHSAQLRRTVPTQVLEKAQASGVTVQPQSTLKSSARRAWTVKQGRLPGMHGVEKLYCAQHLGQVVAVNGVGLHDGHGEVLMTPASWITDSPQPSLIEQALVAAILLNRPTLPDLLIGTGDASIYLEWFHGEIELEHQKGYVLNIDAKREPTRWEFALGFNPRRLWLIPPRTQSGF